MSLGIAPAWLMAVLLAVGYASLCHLWSGRTLRDLLIYLVMAGIGFGFGQTVGVFTQAPFFQMGQLHTLEASAGAWVLLMVSAVLAK